MERAQQAENPFTLTFGKRPAKMIPRREAFDEVAEAFEQEEPSAQVFIITGVRGSGKTVFLSDIAAYFGGQDNWLVADLNVRKASLVEDLEVKLVRSRKISAILQRLQIEVQLPGVRATINPVKEVANAEENVVDILTAMKREGKRLLITIDDISLSSQLSVFGVTLQSFIRANLPVFVLVTGRYEKVKAFQEAENLTFWSRAIRINMAPLNLRRIAENYRDIFACPQEQALAMAKQTGGYAYAFQLLGFFSWKFESDPQKISKNFQAYLFDYAYDQMWNELTAVERRVMAGIAALPSGKVKEIRTYLGMDSNYFNQYRRRLVEKGMLISENYGCLKLAMPLFGAFIKDRQYLDE